MRRVCNKKFLKDKFGFTLVEVIITVIIIAVLAATSLVIYTNWRSQALVTQIKNDLNSAATTMESIKNFGTGYPSSIPSNFIPSDGVNITLISSSGNKYCIDGSSTVHSSDSSYHYHIKQGQTSATAGLCSDDNQGVPGAPTNVVATAQSSSAIEVTWSAGSGGAATEYSVQRSTDSGFANSVVTDVVSSTLFISSSLLANTTYYYRVLASNDDGSSGFSSIVNATTSQGSCSGDAYGTYPNCYAYDSNPVGTSISGYFTSAPSGYLLEDGSAVSRTTYSDLFAVIGTTYGVGDGSTTFNLPDSRGRVGVNLNTSDSQFSTIGEKYGEISHTLTVAELPPHQHSIRAEYGVAGVACSNCGPPNIYNQLTTNTAYVFQTAYTTLDGGGGGSHNVVQPSIVKLSAIKWNIPPVYNSDTVSVGTSISGYFTSAPSGYLLEDGSAVSRTTYSDLFAVIGTTYGVGDGSTTFNLPDSRGRVGVNLSLSSSVISTEFDTIGEKYGEISHTLTVAELPPHQHSIRAEYGNNNLGNYPPPSQYNQLTAHTGYAFQTAYTTLDGGGGGSHNVVQPSIVKLSVIKATGTVDPSAINASPTGTSISGYFTSAPSGYLLEDGSAVSRTTYSDLFAVIGTTYGVGDGSTTFNLPDSRGRVGVNLNTSDSQFSTIGEKYGEISHTLTVAELPPHQHSIRAEYGVAGVACSDCGPPGRYNQLTTNTAYVFQTAYTTLDGGGGGSYNIIQPSIVKLYVIKY